MDRNANAAKRGKGVNRTLRRMILTALFVAMSVAVKSVTKLSLSFFGAGGMQISFGGIFTFFPAALFGPLWGGIATALTDIIGCIVAPTGAYIPWLTVTAFCSGFIKGLIWKFLTAKAVKRSRIPVLVVFLCLALLGFAFGSEFHSTGLLPQDKLFSTKEDVPHRWELDDYSDWGVLTLNLVQYFNDTYTLTQLPESAVVDYVLTLPSSVVDTADSNRFTPTKVAKEAYEGLPAFTVIRVPARYKTVNAPDGVTVETVNDAETENLVTTDEGYRYQSSDTYRKYLSGYMNFLYPGLLFISFSGMLFIALNYLLSLWDKKRERLSDSVRIALSLLISGSVATTVNTFILRAYTASWAGRVFLYIWIPRIVEEWIVCLIQTFVIAALWGLLTRGRLRRIYLTLAERKD